MLKRGHDALGTSDLQDSLRPLSHTLRNGMLVLKIYNFRKSIRNREIAVSLVKSCNGLNCHNYYQ